MSRLWIGPSKYAFYAGCGLDELLNIRDEFPTEVSSVEEFIQVIEPLKQEKDLMFDIMTDLTAVIFPDLIPTISEYMGIRDPTNEEKARINERMQHVDPEFTLGSYIILLDNMDEDDEAPDLRLRNLMSSRLEDNMERMADVLKVFPHIVEVQWSWRMLKDRYDMICEKLKPSSVKDELNNSVVNQLDDQIAIMPEEWKDTKFVLLCYDGTRIEIKTAVASQIGFILKNVIKFADKREEVMEVYIPLSSEDVKAVVNFCNRVVDGLEPLRDDLTQDGIFELHGAADLLQIDSLLDWTAQLIVEMIRGKTGPEIRGIVDLEAGGAVRQAER